MTNIRSPESFEHSWWDWTQFNDCFSPTQIRITDVDGLVERHGHFLLIETKRPGVEVPRGQSILFDAIRKNPRWHILIIWGETDCPQSWQVWGKKKWSMTGTTKDLHALIRRWFHYADGAK